MYIFRMFLISWLITVVVEEAVTLIWNGRSFREILTVLWVNTVTNPAAAGFRLLSNRYFPEQWMRSAVMVLIEAVVVLAEWRLLRRFMIRRRNYFLFSVILNAASYCAGLFFPVIMTLLR